MSSTGAPRAGSGYGRTSDRYNDLIEPSEALVGELRVQD